MAKRFKYAFAKKKEAEEGVFSTILAGLSLLLFIVAAILSFSFQGKGGLYLGAIGLIAMLFAAYGFFKGLRSFSAEDRNHKFSIIGSIANGIVVVGWFALFLVGIV